MSRLQAYPLTRDEYPVSIVFQHFIQALLLPRLGRGGLFYLGKIESLLSHMPDILYFM